jgi:hypothetical protein
VSDRTEQVQGWRVWRLHEGRLHSLVVDFRWEPGENRAVCLALGRRACPHPPGDHCNCGFWAAWSPRQALSRTCATVEPPWQVMGLIAASGELVPYGAEGFRAERATLRCLFTDRPWSWWGGVDQGPGWEALRAVAADYAVPLLSLDSANLLSSSIDRPAAATTRRMAG